MRKLISPYIVGTISFSDVSNQPPYENYIINSIKEFDLFESLILFSRLNFFLCDTEFAVSLENQKILCEKFLNRYYRDKVYEKLSHNKILFNRHQILYLIRKVFLHCTEKNGFSFEYVGKKHILGICCLIANYFIYFPAKSNSVFESMSDFEKKIYLWHHFLPSYEIHNPPDIRHEIVRNRYIYKSILSKIEELKYINDVLLKIESISLDDYLNIMFSIIALFLQRREGILNYGGKTFIEKKELLANTNFDPDAVSRILSLISFPYYKYKDEIAKSGESENPFNFITFRKYPLVNIKEKFFCLDLNFVNDKLSLGLFWLIHDNLQNELKNKYHSDWGFLFEEYIKSIFKRYFPENKYHFNPKYSNSEDEVADTIYIEKENLVLFEYKFTVLSSRAKYEEDINDLIKEIKRKFMKNEKGEWKGIGQLANNINKLFSKNMKVFCAKIDKKKIKRIFPILIVNESILNSRYSNFILNEEFKSLINYSQLIDELEIMPLSVITIEDFEILNSLISKYDFVDLISKRFKEDPNLDNSFSDYLINLLNSNPDLMTEYINDINEKYQEWFNSAKKDIFG